MIKRRLISAASALVLATSSCAYNSNRAPSPVIEDTGEQILERLYFGRSIPSGGSVSEEDWRTFLADVVTPRFPAGLTVLRGEGQWRDANGVIAKENSFVLELAHPIDAAADQAVRAIMREYRLRFKQEAVLRIQTRVRIEFESASLVFVRLYAA